MRNKKKKFEVTVPGESWVVFSHRNQQFQSICWYWVRICEDVLISEMTKCLKKLLSGFLHVNSPLNNRNNIPEDANIWKKKKRYWKKRMSYRMCTCRWRWWHRPASQSIESVRRHQGGSHVKWLVLSCIHSRKPANIRNLCRAPETNLPFRDLLEDSQD